MSPPVAPKVKGGRVLIVGLDDDLRSALVGCAPVVNLAPSAYHALRLATDKGFDVAVIDVELPGERGVDLIEPLREIVPLGEVILVTGFATMDESMAALQSGAFGLLRKPVEAEELASLTTQALAKVRLRREQKALEKRALDAEAVSKMGQLALNLAHEIRNPLNAAVLQLHLLGRDIDKQGLPEGVRSAMWKRVRIVEGEIGRLNRLLTEFLELARPRAIAREPVHMGHLVEEVIELERDNAEGAGIVLSRSVEGDGWVTLGDREKLKQVIINLVVNALEAMKDGGGTLVSRVFTDDGEAGPGVVFELTDSGPGIPPDVLSQIFDPFFTTKEAGTGLGLSIVSKIVEQHQGHIEFLNRDEGGTRVRVWLPRSIPTRTGM